MALFSEYYVGDTTTEESDKEGATPFVNTCLCDRRECIFNQVEIVKSVHMR